MKLLIISDGPRDINAMNLAKIANFYGIEQVNEPPGSCNYAIVVRQANLGVISGLPPAKAILVYDCCQSDERLKVIPCLGNRFNINIERDITHQLSGLSISAPCPKGSHMFSAVGDAQTLVSLGDKPFLFHKYQAGCSWFFLGSSKVVNVNSEVNDNEFTFDDIFAEIIPYAIFFQHMCPIKKNCYANLIIDDPSLLKRYGFINYREMSALISSEDFAVTIAFIPWNHKRSDMDTVKLFTDNRDRLTICVHGCDHTAGEFGSVDGRIINWKASLARIRMDEHKSRFGLPYDNVMVFPQGVFSEKAMCILQRHGFVAAVNTNFVASDYSGGLKILDLMTPATTHYGLPLFMRRYPKRIEDFAYDLFFGRPALIVQHHADFADGWDHTLSFLKKLTTVEPNLQWMPLGRIVEKMSPTSREFELNETGFSENYYDYTPRSYLKTALRRLMCDIRDNVVMRSKPYQYFRTKQGPYLSRWTCARR
jgi:hypothetical protein